MRFRGFRRNTGRPWGWGTRTAWFPTRIEGADRGLYFDAVFYYDWRLTGTGRCTHPDAVARTLVRDLAVPIARRFTVALVGEAESAVNAALSGELILDPRLSCTATARLTCGAETRALAEHRLALAEPILAEEAARALRLELLRACIVEHGPLYWLDRDTSAGHVVEDPAARTRSALEAHSLLRTALSEDRRRTFSDDASRLRARFEDLLVTLQDPVLGERLLALLESLRETVDPSPSSAAVPMRARA